MMVRKYSLAMSYAENCWHCSTINLLTKLVFVYHYLAVARLSHESWAVESTLMLSTFNQGSAKAEANLQITVCFVVLTL